MPAADAQAHAQKPGKAQPAEVREVVAPVARAALSSLVLHEPVRSGQSIVFPEGDVTVIGSIASGAEVIAGGSIHVYGALRGRALAGSIGNSAARIFCRKLEAELLAIDGIYKTADDLPAELRGQAAQLWLENDAIMASRLT
jgi:septum site-determining protein MinC